MPNPSLLSRLLNRAPGALLVPLLVVVLSLACSQTAYAGQIRPLAQEPSAPAVPAQASFTIGGATVFGDRNAVAPTLYLNLGGAGLTLQQASVSGERVTSSAATLQLPPSVGTLPALHLAGVVIDQQGLAINSDNRVAFADADIPIGGYHMTGGEVTVSAAAARGTFKISLRGPVAINAAGRTQTVMGQVDLYENGVVRRTLEGPIDYDVAGLILSVDKLETADEPPPSPPSANAAPVADDQKLSTAQGVPLGITLTASDGDNDSLTYTVVSQPSNGVLSGTPPDLTYTPDASFSGEDSFTFMVNDGKVDSDVAEVHISVVQANTAPQAFDQPADAQVNTATDIGLSAEDIDGDTLVYTIVDQPAHGTLSGSDAGIPGTVTYTPQQDYSGPDSFTFQANDGQLDSNLATVSITVGPTVPANVLPPAAVASMRVADTVAGALAGRNLAPVANDRTIVAQMSTPAAVSLTASDNEHDSLAFVLVTQPAGGQLIGSPPNLVYVPHPGFSGEDSFQFTAVDGHQNANVATVTIVVRSPASVQAASVQGVLTAVRGLLKAPEEFGGGSVTVNGITITAAPNQPPVITISGGERNRFDLPRIAVAGFALGLSGSLEPGTNGSQLIRAKGEFAVPSMGKAIGCDGIEISVLLERTAGSLTVLSIEPPPTAGQKAIAALDGGPYAPEYIQSLQLREAGLSLDCAIPIGTTGFKLTSVSGKIELSPSSTTVRISASIASDLAVGQWPVLGIDGSVRLTTSPFQLGLEGGIKVFTFHVASGDAMIWTRGFKATIKVEIVVGRGEFTVNSWYDNNRFHMTGSGFAEIGVNKGSLGTECLQFLFFKFCSPIPPFSTAKVRAGAQVGEFQNGAWGFKAYGKIDRFSVGVYVDSEGRVKFGSVDAYKLVTAPQVFAAYQALLAAAQNGETTSAAVSTAALDGYQFANAAAAFPLTVTQTITNQSELLFVLTHRSDNVQFSLVTPDGREITSDPATWPTTVAFRQVTNVTSNEELGEVPAIVDTFSVADAQPGEWSIVISGNPGPDDFFVQVLGHPDQPVIEQADGMVMRAAANGGAQQPVITWRLTSASPDTVVALYANPGPIEETYTITNPNGTPEQVTVPSYTGYRLAENLPTTEDGSPQTYTLQPDELPSGTYHIWLQVDDGINPPVQKYLPEPLVVDNSGEWAPAWQAGLTAEAGYEDVHLAWHQHPNPDVDYYIVYVGDRPGTANPKDAVDSFVVGTDEGFDLFNLDGGQTLYFAVAAVDDAAVSASGIDAAAASAQRSSISEEVEATTKTVDFTLTPAAAAVSVGAGKSASLALQVKSTVEPFPDLVYLFDDCGLDDLLPPEGTSGGGLYLPMLQKGSAREVGAAEAGSVVCTAGDGIVVTFDNDFLTPSQSGAVTTMTISASAATKPGQYVLPIIGESNNAWKQADILVTVTP